MDLQCPALYTFPAYVICNLLVWVNNKCYNEDICSDPAEQILQRLDTFMHIWTSNLVEYLEIGAIV